jgi:hypothetical protein
MTSSVFVLKPIIDMLYEEAKNNKDEIDTLKKKIKELEEENAKLYTKNKKLEQKMEQMEDMDDVYANIALAPPSSSPQNVLKQVENQKNNIENDTLSQEECKSVNVNTQKDRKEYMKEYQRTYRKKQKDLTLNL